MTDTFLRILSCVPLMIMTVLEVGSRTHEPKLPKKKYTDAAIIYDEDVRAEDGGCAQIYEFDGFSEDMFVVLHSWNAKGEHKEFDGLIGKKVRVTLEVID